MTDKKSKNSRPILSILIDEDKRSRFAALAGQHKLSMGWLVNQAIDKMLDSGSIDIYKSSIIPTEILDITSVGIQHEAASIGLSADNIDELVSKAVEKHLEGIHDIEVMLMDSMGIVNVEVKSLEKRLDLSEQLVSSQGREIERLKKAIGDRVSEVFLDSIASPINNELTPDYEVDRDTLEPEKTQDIPVDLSKLQSAHNLTWGEFVSAVGMRIQKDRDRKTIQNVRLARIAIDRATELDSPGWEYISLNRRFIRV